MSTVPPIDSRMSQGDRYFLKYVTPRIQDQFPGSWYSTAGAPCDWIHGIDFIHVHGHQIQTVSARVWKSMAHNNFTSRFYRTSDPGIKLEYQTKIEALMTGGLLTDWTIESFINNRELVIAAIPTRILYEHLHRLGDVCPRFIVQNEKDSVWFKRVDWLDLHEHVIQWSFTA